MVLAIVYIKVFYLGPSLACHLFDVTKWRETDPQNYTLCLWSKGIVPVFFYERNSKIEFNLSILYNSKEYIMAPRPF